MTNKEKQDWLKDKHPLTIITDRYGGTYSGGGWLAFPLDYDEIPTAVNDSDLECATFWKDYLEPVGKGNSAKSAIDNLISQMHKQEDEEKDFEHKLGEIIYKSIPVYSIEDDKKVVEIADKRAKYYAPILLKLAEKKLQEEELKKEFEKGFKEAVLWGREGYEVSPDGKVKSLTQDEIDSILEKQKEQKPSINIDQLKSLMLQYLQEAANEKDDSDIEADTDKWARKILGYNFEQKPADLPAGFYYIDGKGNKYYSKEFRCSNELGGYVSLKVAEQKPSWSEEDEEMLDSIIKVVCGVGSQPNGLREKQVNWLKSLRPQPQWKPSEKEITAFENMLKGEFPDGIFPGVTLSALLAKLKKLHYNESIPSWKPSEEQISAVKHAYNSFPDYCPAKLGLKSLYEDLKKL